MSYILDYLFVCEEMIEKQVSSNTKDKRNLSKRDRVESCVIIKSNPCVLRDMHLRKS